MKMIKTYLSLFFIIITTTCLLSNCNNSQTSRANTPSPEDTLVQIPNEWINKLKNPKSPTHELVNEFQALLYPERKDSLVKKKITDELMLKPTFINIDQSPEEELLLWIGHVQICEFAIIKQIKGKWYLLYNKDHFTLWNYPKLRIGDSLSKQNPKVLYTSNLYGRGSGFGWGKWHFFRIENNRVITGLKVIDGAVLSTVEGSIGHDVHTIVQIKSIDSINIIYDYAFTLGRASLYLNSTYFQQNDSTLMSVPFIKGEINMTYTWNQTTQKYQLEDKALQAKEKFMNDYGQVIDFYNAFESEIKQSKHPNKDKIIEAIHKTIRYEEKQPKVEGQTFLMLGYLGPSYYESRAQKRKTPLQKRE